MPGIEAAPAGRRTSVRIQSAQKRALLVTPECPYPILGGGAMRTASVLEYLAPRFEVDVIVFRQPGHPPPAEAFPRGLVRDVAVLDLRHHSRAPMAWAWRNAVRLARRVPPLIDRFSGFDQEMRALLAGREYDLAVVEHFWCAPYVRWIAPHAGSVVLNLHNIESEWHDRCAAAASRREEVMAHRLFRDASWKLERRLLPRFDLVLTTSEDDARRVGHVAPSARAALYPNAIPLVPPPAVPEEEVVAFSASFDYEPNRAAVRHFNRSIWPILRERWPELRWRLIGRNEHAVARYVRGDPRVECTGRVDDAMAHLAAAKVVVVPLLAGSGTRLKIIEAWAARRAVVSTHLGAEGLPVEAGRNILLRDDPERFAAAVSALLESPERRSALAGAGRRTYERSLTWEAAWQHLDAALASLAPIGKPVSC